jgi:hypothetical protein
MTVPLDDWDSLGAEWRTMAIERHSPSGVPALQSIVQRRRRELILVLAGEVCLTIAVIALVIRSLGNGFTRTSILAVTLLVVTSMAVWGFVIWNRRGIWRPLAETTTEYLRLSRRRIVAGRRTVAFVRAWTGVYFLMYGPWYVIRVARHTLNSEDNVRWMGAALYGVGLVLWSAWYSRRLTRDLAEIEAIEQSLGLSQVSSG